ncbi:MAG: phage antirepressor N-terminal domain-containing protein [Leadbetterella sp.]
MENTAIQMFKSTVVMDSTMVISAKPLCDFFGLDWSNQQKLFKNDPHLAQLMVKKPSVAEDGKTREMIHFTKKGFLRWVQLINPNTVRDNLKEKFLNYQMLIFDYLYGSMEEQAKMQRDYLRMRELEDTIKNCKEELKEIKSNVGLFLDARYGQLSLF